ncbi:MAG: 50S ribosomal protein L21 [Hirschia sp.]|nr:50S ribosomal protein L21 [Hirschia sp.]MBB36815.1 50S ribosomal protein L21 [Hirschia sp.]MBF19006.1 50S ribosomal protein L21 [Hirschia sp.]|tara:strand:- start:305 stop:928 length:624 start_codon:yes stop_codon:yes gene_type:complete
MFAVIKTGGKQYKVAQDDVLVVEKLEADAGSEFVFDSVLMMGDGDKIEMGAPTVSGAQVVAEVVEQRKGAKVIIFKKRQRNTYRRKKGHRQHETVIKITEILAKGGKKAAAKKAEPAKAEAPKVAAPKTEAAPKAAPAPTAEAGSDDLTKLTGIGKVAAGKLVEAGFTTYAQLASLSDADFAKLDEDIFKGRVPQDQLTSEAKELQG